MTPKIKKHTTNIIAALISLSASVNNTLIRSMATIKPIIIMAKYLILLI